MTQFDFPHTRVYAEYFDNDDYVQNIVECMLSNRTNAKASFKKQGLFVSCVAYYMVFLQRL